MVETSAAEVIEIASAFRIDGEVTSAEPHGRGHIHETWVSRVEGPAGVTRYVLQQINQRVFTSPGDLMENLSRVTSHLRRKIAAEGGDPARETLTVVETREGSNWLRSDTGQAWRCTEFIEATRAVEAAANPEQAYEIGRGFGQFLYRLSDLPGPRLHETIPGFANGAARVAGFRKVLEENPRDRARGARPEIAFARAQAGSAGFLNALVEQRLVPERTIHFDTKCNNVLLDEATGRAVCVIDLDTVMPGTALFDFGDAIRRGACPAAEDETDLSSVTIDLDLFTGLATGWLDQVRGLLVPAERENLVPAVRTVALTLGLRFLTDYLAGDHYFRVSRDDHNLERCRNQFALVEEIDRRAPELRRALEGG